MKHLRLVMLFAAAAVAAAAQTCEGLPPGKHSLLERFTEAFGLTCEQQLESKPLLAFAAFSPEEQRAVMLKIKLAARRQVKTLLTPDQQKKMDEEIASVAATGTKSSGKKGGAKKTARQVDPFENEEALSQAI